MKFKFTILILLSLIIFVPKSISQSDSSKSWLYKYQDPNVNFYEVQKEFNAYWQNRTDYKSNGWKVFKRWEYINQNRILSNGKLQTPEYVFEEYNKYQFQQDKKVNNSKRSISGTWSLVGPLNYPTNNTSQPTGMGRINALAFHPTDANTIYSGAPSGGIWKTTNGGGSWTNISANIPHLGVSSILVHPNNADTIYIGTGDRDADDAPGIGVFKSVNGGATWVKVSTGSNGMGNVTVGAMLMHPSNPLIILAASSGGIYKTINGGKTWSLKIAGDFRDIQFKPNDPSVVFATRMVVPSGFYRSSNTGDNWTQITSGIPTSGIGSRMVIGVTPANNNYVYLVQILASNANFAGILRSTDGGLNFSTQSTTPNILDYACNGSGTASQATYDLCIAVDPLDEDNVFVGSLNNWKSTNGGVNWNIVSHWVGSGFDPSDPTANCAVSVHADQHCYAWSPHNGNLYLGNDGGVFYTSDGGATWPEITNNLGISQIYRIGQSATNANYTLSGLQDNGSAATTTGSNFITTVGGDGMECAVDYTNTNYCYNTYHSGLVRRSTTGPSGFYTEIAGNGINGITESGAWVSPYFIHKSAASTLFLGLKNVWRSTNIKASNASSVVWETISTGETNNCIVLEQSPVNVNIMYVVRSSGMKRTSNANATASSVTWSNCNLPGGIVPTDLKADPNDSNIVFATAGYGVYKSIDKGITWTNMTGNLPALFTNCLAIDKNATEGIYVGNQTGVWYKNSSITDWILFSSGLPPVDVRELEIYYDATPSNNRIFAATYGRGTWKSDLAEISVINPSNFIAKPVGVSQIDLSWIKNLANQNVVIAFSTVDIFGTPIPNTSYSVGASITGGGTVIYNGGATSFTHTGLTAGTTYYYKIWSVNGSNIYSAGLPAINATTYSYQWTAGASTTDWFTPGNWGSNAIPTSEDNIIIPASAPFQPNISAAGAVCGSIIIETGASLTMSNSTAYTLQVGGNFTNNGTFSRGIGIVEFNNLNNYQTIDGTSTTDFNRITVTKSSVDNILEVKSMITLNSSSNPLIIATGTFKLSSASSITPFTSSPTIGNNAGLWNNGGTVNGGAFSWTLNSGMLRISAGTMTIGNAANHNIVYLNSGSLIMEGGSLTLAGRFQPNSGSSSGAYSQSGGDFIVNTQGSTSTTRAMFEINPNATFNLTGGRIIFQRNSSNTSADVMLLSNNSSVSGGTLQFGNASSANGQTFRLRTTSVLPNIELNSTAAPILQIQNNISIIGNLAINGGTFNTANYNVQLAGNLSNSGTLTSGNSLFTFNGNSVQNISGNALININKLTLNNFAGIHLNGSNDLRVDSLITFVNGSISTSSNKVIISDNGLINGVNNVRFINGNCRKIGDDAFIFPIGKGSVYAPISISAPGANTDHFTASYFTGTPHLTYDTTIKQLPVVNLSSNEYWILDRTGGSSNVAVTLTWDARSGTISNVGDLLVGRWDGTKWLSEGSASTTGNTSVGSITSNIVNNFSPFTFANIGLIPLPNNELNFDAFKENENVKLIWTDYTDLQKKYLYTIQRSKDGINWLNINNQPALSASNLVSAYSFIDYYPLFGVSYYRVMRKDILGDIVYSLVKVINFNSIKDIEIVPNPATNFINIITSIENPKITIAALDGKILIKTYDKNNINVSTLSNGIYNILISNGEKQYVEKLLIYK